MHKSFELIVIQYKINNEHKVPMLFGKVAIIQIIAIMIKVRVKVASYSTIEKK